MSEISILTISALEKAYQAQVVKLYSVYAGSYSTAKNDKEKRKKALRRYIKGLNNAKITYQKAIEASSIT